jgi:hypothetical protein
MEKSLMTIQELETQLLSLNPTERLRIAQLLTQSVSANGAPNETWKSIDTLSIDNRPVREFVSQTVTGL